MVHFILLCANIVKVYLGIPNERKRSPEKAREINRKWNDLSTIQHDLSGIRPIYAPRDLYDACKGAIDESHSEALGGESDALPARVVKISSKIFDYFFDGKI